jgi:enoyl-CoA hydratase
MLDADQAFAAHLVGSIVEPDDLLDAGHRLADAMAQQSALALRLTKAAFHAPREAHPLVDDLAQAILFETEDKHDRMTAFLERKK